MFRMSGSVALAADRPKLPQIFIDPPRLCKAICYLSVLASLRSHILQEKSCNHHPVAITTASHYDQSDAFVYYQNFGNKCTHVMITTANASSLEEYKRA